MTIPIAHSALAVKSIKMEAGLTELLLFCTWVEVNLFKTTWEMLPDVD